MGQEIITGYTGTRHITPEMDAAVWRSAFGENNYILATGHQCAGSMPSINEFVISDGVVSIQGYLGYGTHESLTIDTCTTGFGRIDLVCARYGHDVGTLIDSIEYVVIKGTEVAQPNVPTPPTYHTGIIKDGATEVDFPLYQVNLEGGNVTFTQLANVKEATSTTISMTATDGTTASVTVVKE